MNSKNELENAIVSFLLGERGPENQFTVIRELVFLGKISTEWPKASEAEWIDALQSAVASGKLISIDHVIRIADPDVQPKPKKPFEQPMLFS